LRSSQVIAEDALKNSTITLNTGSFVCGEQKAFLSLALPPFIVSSRKCALQVLTVKNAGTSSTLIVNFIATNPSCRHDFLLLKEH
jgi:hypothetical protein